MSTDCSAALETALPARDNALTAPPLRVWRLARGVVHILAMWLAALLLAPRLRGAGQRALVHRCAARLLDILGVQVTVRGEIPLPEQPLLLVANHVSWLDTYAIHTVSAARFVAKAEVRDWPIIGTVAARFGTFFIRRGSCRAAYHTKQALAGALRAGGVVAAFPEGTTTDGRAVGRFYPALLQAAIDAGVPVQPVAIRYRTAAGARSDAAVFIDDMTIAESVRRLLRTPALVAEVAFCRPLEPGGLTRRDLANAARHSVAQALVGL